MLNIVLCMTDDQGWGDVGYNGHVALRTPHLDSMARSGIRFDRFYAAAPVCSPTRGSCITGRHPYRYGVFFANEGHMRRGEITLAEALKTKGYTTGHFGKWHLGTLTTTVRDGNRGGRPEFQGDYAPPWERGFDVCFSTESKVPTWNPLVEPKTGQSYGTHYWREGGEQIVKGLDGCDSRIIVDRAIPFIREAVAKRQPFLAVIWFHTPHLPVVAGPQYRRMYSAYPEAAQHYYGAITAMDEQVGRLRQELRHSGVAENTMLWFCSDNGPEGPKEDQARHPGSAGPFRGRKRSLFEGGVRVPGILEWPARISRGFSTSVACSTLDYYPTVMEALSFRMQCQPEPIDGVSLLPLIEGTMTQRSMPIGFESQDKVALIGNRYKLVRDGRDSPFLLFDLLADPGERTDLSAERPQIVAEMRATLERWRASCRDSLEGRDYGQGGLRDDQLRG